MEVEDAFKFCPRCGAETTVTKRLMSCPKCGLDTYFSPKPVQSVILYNSAHEYLFTKRAFEPDKGLLDFPGGFAEPNETFEETTRRELKEEVGIEVGELEYFSSHKGDYPFQGINYKVIGTTYIAKLPENAVLKPADDVEAVEFYKIADVPRDRLAGQAMREAVDMLAEWEAKRR